MINQLLFFTYALYFVFVLWINQQCNNLSKEIVKSSMEINLNNHNHNHNNQKIKLFKHIDSMIQLVKKI